MTIETTYAHDIETWRASVEANLRADDGVLTQAGLFWLHEGIQTIGSDEASDLLLPEAAPARFGELLFDGNTVTFRAAPGLGVLINGQSVPEAVLRADTEGEPDIVRWQHLSFLIIKRGQRIGVRLRDNASLVRRNFSGRIWFPVDEAFRLEAHFVRYDPPKPLSITNILGDTSDTTTPGYVEFAYDGQTYQLDVTSTAPGGYGIFFRDATSGHETYGASRSVFVPLTHGELVVLDFNRAANPPCAFTAYATCPLPPRQNILPFAIRAGERYEDHEQQL